MSEQSRDPRPSSPLTRRAFFRALLVEARQATASLSGAPSFSLADLQALPAEELARLVPEVQPGWALHVDGDRLVARERGSNVLLDLLPASRENVLAMNLLDGRRTIDSAARRLAREMGWPEEQAFEHVRQLFFTLAGALVCLPREAGDVGE